MKKYRPNWIETNFSTNQTEIRLQMNEKQEQGKSFKIITCLLESCFSFFLSLIEYWFPTKLKEGFNIVWPTLYFEKSFH